MSDVAYSRENPSPRYRHLVAQYRQMHETAPPYMFAGRQVFSHIHEIRRLVTATGTSSLLDYGSGKGAVYQGSPVTTVDGRNLTVADAIGVATVTCYDPGVPAHDQLPADRFDGVICLDVLEHIPDPDIAWVLREIFTFARRFAYMTIACRPAKKSLPDGSNAHETVRPPEWWSEILERASNDRAAIWYIADCEILAADGTFTSYRLERTPRVPELAAATHEMRRRD